MKDNKWSNKKGIILTIGGLVALYIIGRIFVLNNNTHEAASIGIIGGADGPTAIFLAKSVAREKMDIIALGLILVVGISVLIYKKRKK